MSDDIDELSERLADAIRHRETISHKDPRYRQANNRVSLIRRRIRAIERGRPIDEGRMGSHSFDALYEEWGC